MIIIAESGSTKTDWRMIETSGKVGQLKSAGINPYYQTKEQIVDELKRNVLSNIKGDIESIYFYGAGLTNNEKKDFLGEILLLVFPNTKNIEVFDDMTAAARSLCGSKSGIACILGTGANTCFYDGSSITYQIPSLGFWLGDEGSGAYLGKTFIQKYLHNELPEEIVEKFDKRFGKINRLEVIENAYQKPFPNRYFAGFSKFLFDNRMHPYIYSLITESFQLFFEKYINKYPDYKNQKIHFTGSVAFYYSDILRRVATTNDATLGVIMETPIAGLTLYHQQSMNI